MINLPKCPNSGCALLYEARLRYCSFETGSKKVWLPKKYSGKTHFWSPFQSFISLKKPKLFFLMKAWPLFLFFFRLPYFLQPILV